MFRESQFFIFSDFFLYFSLDCTSRGLSSKRLNPMDVKLLCRDSRISIEDQVCRATSWPAVNLNLAFLARDLCAVTSESAIGRSSNIFARSKHVGSMPKSAIRTLLSG